MFLALVGGVFVISNLGVNVLGAVAGLGIGGLALALAAQDSVANFFGSVVLFTDAPFQVGDYVGVNGVTGTVQEVGFRTTRIRQDDSSVVCIPNQAFTGSVITNHSERTGRVVAFGFGLMPDADPAALDAFLAGARTALAEHENLSADTVEVHLTGFQEWAIEVRVKAFTVSNDWSEFLATREAALLRLMSLLRSLGLTLAHPARTLYHHDAASGDGASREAVFSEATHATAAPTIGRQRRAAQK